MLKFILRNFGLPYHLEYSRSLLQAMVKKIGKINQTTNPMEIRIKRIYLYIPLEKISFTLYFEDIVTERIYFLKRNSMFGKPVKFYIFLCIYIFVGMDV